MVSNGRLKLNMFFQERRRVTQVSASTARWCRLKWSTALEKKSTTMRAEWSLPSTRNSSLWPHVSITSACADPQIVVAEKRTFFTSALYGSIQIWLWVVPLNIKKEMWYLRIFHFKKHNKVLQLYSQDHFIYEAEVAEALIAPFQGVESYKKIFLLVKSDPTFI